MKISLGNLNASQKIDVPKVIPEIKPTEQLI
jgi:hypothetical protein